MKRRPQIRYTDAQKALMWERWQKGECLHDIASAADKAAWQRVLRPKTCKLADYSYRSGIQ